RDRGEGRIAQLPRPELLSVHHRHHEVEQDERGRRHGLQPLERLLAVRGADDPMALVLEDRDQRIAQIEIVLDDEDGRGAIVHLVGHGVPLSSRSIRFPRGGGCQNFEPPAPAAQDAWSPRAWPGACLGDRGMSLLPRGYLDTTVAIESARADGEAIRYRTIGTGFFIGLDYGDRSTSSAENYRLFLVTNRHVLADRGDLLTRVNTREGAARRGAVRARRRHGDDRGRAQLRERALRADRSPGRRDADGVARVPERRRGLPRQPRRPGDRRAELRQPGRPPSERPGLPDRHGT